MDIIAGPQGYYWPMSDCRIGPYRDGKECREDYERYLKTGKISTDQQRTLGVARCVECEGI